MDFNVLFKPRTLAVVGVSLTHERHPANVIYHKNNLRQEVKVFPVNVRGGVLNGETVYAHLSELPKRIDLAVIATRADVDTLLDGWEAAMAGENSIEWVRGKVAPS